MAKRFQKYEPHKVQVNLPSIATEPGLVPLSDERLKRIHPELYELSPWMFWLRKHYLSNEQDKLQIAEQLYYGDSPERRW